MANWVGKRNHKFFILFQFWGFVFAVSLIAWQCFGRAMTVCVIDILALVVEIIFALVLGSCLFCAVDRAASNITHIDRFKHVEREDKGTIVACREVFGDGLLICWLFPTAPSPNTIQLI
jgi:hypothetical protein